MQIVVSARREKWRDISGENNRGMCVKPGCDQKHPEGSVPVRGVFEGAVYDNPL